MKSIRRLGEGYDTDCYDYESDNNFGYYRMRSDCLNDCYQDKIRQLCKVDHGLFMSEFLIRKDYLVEGNEKMISCYNMEYNFQNYSIIRYCEKMCKAECISKYYPLEIERVKSYQSLIKIYHGEFPDILIKNIPEITSIELICNFGGLLGMWLGLSLFGIFNDIFNLTVKFAYQKYINMIIIKFERVFKHFNFKLAFLKIILRKYSIKMIKIKRKKQFRYFSCLKHDNFKVFTVKIVKTILVFLLLCGFLYQAHLIYLQYMSGKTIISLEISQIPDDSPPAITICTELYSMERAGKFHHGFTAINELYQELLRNESTATNYDIRKSYHLARLFLYNEVFYNYNNGNFKNNGLDMNELFDKMTIKYKALDGSQTVSFGFIKREDNNTVPGEWEIESNNIYHYNYTGDPLESIVILNNPEKYDLRIQVKCMTFFSHAQQQWRNIQVQIEMFKIKINSYAVSSIFEDIYYIAIHSTNKLPDFYAGVTFKKLNIKGETTIKYSEQKVKRLGKGYDTDCYPYSSENNVSYYRMRSDCVNDCFLGKMRKICKVDRGIFMSPILIRKDTLINGNDKMILCNVSSYYQDIFSTKQDCEKICKVDCIAKYYAIEFDRIDYSGREDNFITIIHSEYPDIYVQHIPELNLIGFLCNLGGLFGMWLGRSLCALFNDIFKLIYMFPYRNSISFVSLHVTRLAYKHCNFIFSNRFIRYLLNK